MLHKSNASGVSCILTLGGHGRYLIFLGFWGSAHGGGETGQEQKSRPPRSRGRGRGQGGKGIKGDGEEATPEAVSETTSNKADDGKFLSRSLVLLFHRICLSTWRACVS